MTRKWLWRKLCGESCCGESYVAKVIVKWQRGESYVAKVAVANMKRGESYSAQKRRELQKLITFYPISQFSWSTTQNVPHDF